ncbi:MAG: HdeD family acid-resistance protein [Oscillospiraceae bacterium]
MHTSKENTGGIVTCLVEVLVGILLLVNPIGFTSGIIIALGILLLIGGVVKIIRYFRISAEQSSMEQNLFKGLIGVIAGLFCILRSQWFIVTFPVLTILYGVINLIAGLFKVQLTVDAIRLKSRWGWSAFSAVVTILFAAIILLNPFSSTVFLWTFTAVTLIIEAVLDLLSMIFSSRRKSKNS